MVVNLTRKEESWHGVGSDVADQGSSVTRIIRGKHAHVGPCGRFSKGAVLSLLILSFWSVPHSLVER